MQCNIEGNLYYSQISPDLLAIITREIDALDTGKAHRWEDRSGLKRISLVEQPGTAFLFQGELRTAWKHELKPVATKRIAVQFRT